MKTWVRSPKDLALGLIYLGIGAVGLWIALDFPMGRAGRMGPGYFPRVICSLLICFGIVSIALGLLRKGEAIAPFAWRPLAIVIGSTALFAVLLEPAGLLLSLALYVGLSSLAAANTRITMGTILSLAALIAFCALVFIVGLGLPIRFFGTWFGG